MTCLLHLFQSVSNKEEMGRGFIFVSCLKLSLVLCLWLFCVEVLAVIVLCRGCFMSCLMEFGCALFAASPKPLAPPFILFCLVNVLTSLGL